MMQFGTPVLSKKKSLQSTFERTEKGLLALTIIKMGTFLFERPDNGKVIIEMDDTLCHESLEDVLPFNDQTVEQFKMLITERYKRLIAQEVEKLTELSEQIKETERKIKEREDAIQAVETKNKVVFSETRAKSIQQQVKALRKYQKRLQAIAVNVHTTKAKIVEYDNCLAYSLEKASIQLEKALLAQQAANEK